MRLNTVLPLTLGLLATVPGALGWGAAGHEIIATIAEIYLHPTVMPTVCAILDSDDCHLSSIASWADRVRYQMRWSAPLHYVGALGDYPSDRCVFPGERGWSGRTNMNVLGAIRNVSGILEDWVDARASRHIGSGRVYAEEDGAASEALKFLVHFIGDMHMPLHLTGRDRGGNGDKVTFDGRVTNLHSVWDNFLIAQRIRTMPRNYTRPLPSPQVEDVLRGAIYDPYVRRVIWEGLAEGGRWQSKLGAWLECPAALSKSQGWLETLLGWLETLFGLPLRQFVFGTGATPEERDGEVLCPYHWARPIHELNCELVWPKALDEPPYKSLSLTGEEVGCAHGSTPEAEVELLQGTSPRPHEPYLELDTPEYAGVVREEWVVERLVAMAGVRLAGVLNWLFADMEGEGRRGLVWAESLRV